MTAAPMPARYAIFLDACSVMLEIGFLEREIGRAQEILIDVAMELDSDALPSDDVIASAWNYDAIRRVIGDVASSGRFNLQESFARQIFDRLATVPSLRSLTVTTRKPQAYADCRAVGVTLSTRQQPAAPTL